MDDSYHRVPYPETRASSHLVLMRRSGPADAVATPAPTDAAGDTWNPIRRSDDHERSAPCRPSRLAGTLSRAAAEIHDPAERMAFIDRACGHDTALRRRVDELLASSGGRDATGEETDMLDRDRSAEVEEPTDPHRAEPGPAQGESGPTASYRSEQEPNAAAHRQRDRRTVQAPRKRSAKGEWAASTSPSRSSRSNDRSRSS